MRPVAGASLRGLSSELGVRVVFWAGGSAPAAPAAPAVAAARTFLEEAKTGSTSERPVVTGTLAVRDAEKLLY